MFALQVRSEIIGMTESFSPASAPVRADQEVYPRDPFEPRRVLIELQQNQVEFAHARRVELGLPTLGAYFRTLLAQEMERRNG